MPNKVKSIIHMGNPADVAYILSREQRKLGLKSDILLGTPSPYIHGPDLFIKTNPKTYNRKGMYPYRLVRFWWTGFKYDVIHLHFQTYPIVHETIMAIYGILGKRVILHHHGSDETRNRPEHKITETFVEHSFVSTPNILKRIPHATYIPNPVDMTNLKPINTNNTEFVRIIHAPTRDEIKGTQYINQAIRNLKRNGYNIDYIKVQNVPHNKAIEMYKQADIIIDQLIVGWYGVFAVEAMALGKPVICYINPKLRKEYAPDCPIMQSTTSTIEMQIEMLINNKYMRMNLGVEGIKYAKLNHDPARINKRIMAYYKRWDDEE